MLKLLFLELEDIIKWNYDKIEKWMIKIKEDLLNFL